MCVRFIISVHLDGGSLLLSAVLKYFWYVVLLNLLLFLLYCSVLLFCYTV